MDRLIAGAADLGLSLTRQQVELFERYYGELVSWNRRMNLTAIEGYQEVQLRHFLDSLTVVLVTGPLAPALRLIDVGSGAGMPGVPLKIAFPDIELQLVESVGKKARFLEHLVSALALDGVGVLAVRAEGLAHDEHHRERYDLALARGVARLATLAELTVPFCRPGGTAVAFKKGAIDREVAEAAHAIAMVGGRLREVRAVATDGLEGDRVLVAIDKVSPTPGRYPRRAGIPGKRPL